MLRVAQLVGCIFLAGLTACAGCSDTPKDPPPVTPDNTNNVGPSGQPPGGGGQATDEDLSFSSGVPAGSFDLTSNDPTQASNGVGVNPDGNVVLSATEVSFQFAYIANNQMGTVSKFDTKTGKETGRYYSVIPRDGQGQPLPLAADQNNQPSRTAVDLFGDVWVANRAPDDGAHGAVTKIANDHSSCDANRDGNPELRTSRDLNGDGQISTNPADGEFIVPTDFADPKQYDECILFSTVVGSTNTGPKARAITIGMGNQSAGDIWVGLFHDKKVVKLDAKDGSVKQEIPLAFGPYGAAIDGEQRLWVVQAPTGATEVALALIDAKTGTKISDTIKPSTQVAPGKIPSTTKTNAYGIAIDGKKRVWIAGWSSGPKAIRYEQTGLDVATGVWTVHAFTSAVSNKNTKMGYARGIAADDEGYIWMSADRTDTGTRAAQLVAFNGDTFDLKKFNVKGTMVDFLDVTSAPYPDGTASDTHTSIGVGLDADGHVWVNNFSGTAMRVNRDTGELLITHDQPGQLYTYSDFTGYQLRKFTAPRGEMRKDLTGCGDLTRWQVLTWDAEVPANSAIEAYVKVASTQGDLGNTALTRYGPFTSSPVDLQAAGVPQGAFLRVEFILTSSDRQSSPTLKAFDVKFNCLDGIE